MLLPNYKAISPRANTVLLLFLSMEGLTVVSYVKFSADFENAFHTKILLSVFSQSAIQWRHLGPKKCKFPDYTWFQ